MSRLAAIRERRRVARIAQLREGVAILWRRHSSSEVWLFGSLARGDWDAYSDVDVDVLGLSQTRWRQLKGSNNPY